MKPNTQQQIEEALNSLDAVKQAEVSVSFTQKVMARMENKPSRIVPMRTVCTVAASIALLLAVNVWLGSGYKKQSNNMANKGIQMVVGDYHLQDDLFGF